MTEFDGVDEILQNITYDGNAILGIQALQVPPPPPPPIEVSLPEPLRYRPRVKVPKICDNLRFEDRALVEELKAI